MPATTTYNGVPFRVAKGNACFIMKNKYRPSENLPAGGQVELKAKADVLAFLHSGGLNRDIQHATYVIHYADGTQGGNSHHWRQEHPGLDGSADALMI